MLSLSALSLGGSALVYHHQHTPHSVPLAAPRVCRARPARGRATVVAAADDDRKNHTVLVCGNKTWQGVAENKHSVDVEHPHPPPRVCMRIHSQEESCSHLARVLLCNDPPACRRQGSLNTLQFFQQLTPEEAGGLLRTHNGARLTCRMKGGCSHTRADPVRGGQTVVLV